jgi:hypothetical protein
LVRTTRKGLSENKKMLAIKKAKDKLGTDKHDEAKPE